MAQNIPFFIFTLVFCRKFLQNCLGQRATDQRYPHSDGLVDIWDPFSDLKTNYAVNCSEKGFHLGYEGERTRVRKNEGKK